MKTIIEKFINNGRKKFIGEYDKETETAIKQIHYQPDGTSIKCVYEYDKNNKKPFKKTYYRSDEKFLKVYMNTIKPQVN
ncbi:DUF2963 domain-containing protein [Candidatus Phytoplasma ziziphi]|uniref:DUF2963 domain-containing protein n=1 Tax=Ziziphus jujuba witches'-broom phytoplasma TaxID=135727 RepID=UPI001EDEC6D3|nr:DUF2963 domain-containing protein [Candidatus Phytoplasma ziziphi]